MTRKRKFKVMNDHLTLVSRHKKLSFPLRISSVNVTKSAVSSGFLWIWSDLLKKSLMENSFFMQCITQVYLEYWSKKQCFKLTECYNNRKFFISFMKIGHGFNPLTTSVPPSYRNQSMLLQSKSIDWFLYYWEHWSLMG